MFYYDPQQELFSTIKTELEDKGYEVYDGVLPHENTPYPFIYLGNMQQIDNEAKAQFLAAYIKLSTFGTIRLKIAVLFHLCCWILN